METKICTKCEQEKELSEFSKNKHKNKHKNGKSYVRGTCKKCNNERARGYRKANPERYKKYDEMPYRKTNERKLYSLRYDLKRHYNITPEDRVELMDKQKGCCKICGNSLINPRFNKNDLNIDHDHRTGEIRGLLCSTCNTGLGQFQDSTDLLRKAIAYLEAP